MKWYYENGKKFLKLGDNTDRQKEYPSIMDILKGILNEALEQIRMSSCLPEEPGAKLRVAQKNIGITWVNLFRKLNIDDMYENIKITDIRYPHQPIT